MVDTDLTREFVTDILNGLTMANCIPPLPETCEELCKALLKTWDALDGLDKFDDSNRLEPYCVSCGLPTSRGHEPDCKLSKALPGKG